MASQPTSGIPGAADAVKPAKNPLGSCPHGLVAGRGTRQIGPASGAHPATIVIQSSCRRVW